MPRLRETETDEKLNHRKRICSQVRRVDQTPYQPWHSPLHRATSYAHVAPLHIDKVEVLHLFRCYTHTADRVRDLLYLLWLKTFWCWGCQNGMKTVSWDKPWPTTALKSQRSQQTVQTMWKQVQVVCHTIYPPKCHSFAGLDMQIGSTPPAYFCLEMSGIILKDSFPDEN